MGTISYKTYRMGNFKLLDVRKRDGKRAPGKDKIDKADMLVLPNGKRMQLGTFLSITGGLKLLQTDRGQAYRLSSQRSLKAFTKRFSAAYRGRGSRIARYVAMGAPKSLPEAIEKRRVAVMNREQLVYHDGRARKAMYLTVYRLHRDDLLAQRWARGFSGFIGADFVRGGITGSIYVLPRRLIMAKLQGQGLTYAQASQAHAVMRSRYIRR